MLKLSLKILNLNKNLIKRLAMEAGHSSVSCRVANRQEKSEPLCHGSAEENTKGLATVERGAGQ